MNNIQERFFTLEELCELLGIGRNTAYKLLNTGTIKALRLGRRWKIPQTSVDEYISEILNLKKALNANSKRIIINSD